MKKRFYVLACCLALISLPAAADDLLSVYQQALDNDVELSSAVAALKAKQEVVPQSRADLLPNISLEAGTSTNSRDARGYSEQEYNSHTYNFKFKQPLFNIANWYQLSAAHAQYDQAQAQIVAAQQALIIRAADAYFGVLKAQDTLKASQAHEMALKNQLDQAIQRFNVGLIAITDQYEAQAAYDLSRAERISNESELAIAFEALTTLTMKRHEQIATLQDKLPIVKTTPNNVDAWLNMALSTNPDLKAANEAALASEKQLRQAKAGHLPTVDIIANKIYNKSGSNSAIIAEQTNQDIVGLEFKMPLFEGGGTQSKIREAGYNSLSTKDKAEFVKRSLTQLVNSLYSVVNNDVEKVNARQEAMKSADSALAATQAGYEAGTRDIVEVLQVSKVKYDSQRDYAISRYDYILHSLRLKQAAGTLNENDIRELNQWLTTSDTTAGEKSEGNKKSENVVKNAT
jgi:outer membrane protein